MTLLARRWSMITKVFAEDRRNYESKHFRQHSHATQLECFPAAREKCILKENSSIDYNKNEISFEDRACESANVSNIRGFPASSFSSISRLPIRPRYHFLIGVGPGLQMEIFSPVR